MNALKTHSDLRNLLNGKNWKRLLLSQAKKRSKEKMGKLLQPAK